MAEPTRLAAKVTEEAGELNGAASRDEVVWEAADLLCFTLVRLAAEGIGLDEVERHLDRRERRVRRRDWKTACIGRSSGSGRCWSCGCCLPCCFSAPSPGRSSSSPRR
ncbi:MAG: hypothetical protein R3D28_08455 [Geminicoccaceae bacterium]